MPLDQAVRAITREGSSRLRTLERSGRLFFLHRTRLLVFLIAVVLLLQVQSWWRAGPDAAAYLSIARSVFSGEGVARFGQAHLLYQPGYGVLISPLYLLSAEPFLLISLLQVALAAGSLYLLWKWGRPYFGPGAIVVVALTWANVSFLNGSRRFLSEVPALFLLLASALLLRQCLSPNLKGVRLAGMTALAVVVIAGACMVRYVSIALPAGLGLLALFAFAQKRREAMRLLMLSLVTGIPAALCMFSWIIIDKGRAEANEFTNLQYMQTAGSGLVARLIDTFRLRMSGFGQLLTPGLERVDAQWLNPTMPLYIAIFVLVVWGWWRLLGKTRDVLVAAMPFYFAVYLVWPDEATVRFLLPAMPLMWACLWFVIAGTMRRRYVIASALIVLHLAISAGSQFTDYQREGRLWKEVWPTLAQLKPALIPHRDSMAVRGIERRYTRWWLAYTVDRFITDLPASADIPPTIHAIVQPESLPLPSGFAEVSTASGLRVIARDSSATR